MNARITILHDVATEESRAGDDAEDAASADAAGGFGGEVVRLEQPFMDLTARQGVERGVALKIDTSDAVWLGDVETVSATSGVFHIRVRLRHVLRDFETLARLAERFGSPAPGRVPEGTVVRV